MRDFKGYLGGLTRNENGATSIEYAGIAFAIGLALMTALPFLKGGLQGNLETIAAALGGMEQSGGAGTFHDPADKARQRARAIAARMRSGGADSITTSSVTYPAGEDRAVTLRASIGSEAPEFDLNHD